MQRPKAKRNIYIYIYMCKIKRKKEKERKRAVSRNFCNPQRNGLAQAGKSFLAHPTCWSFFGEVPALGVQASLARARAGWGGWLSGSGLGWNLTRSGKQGRGWGAPFGDRVQGWVAGGGWIWFLAGGTRAARRQDAGSPARTFRAATPECGPGRRPQGLPGADGGARAAGAGRWARGGGAAGGCGACAARRAAAQTWRRRRRRRREVRGRLRGSAGADLARGPGATPGAWRLGGPARHSGRAPARVDGPTGGRASPRRRVPPARATPPPPSLGGSGGDSARGPSRPVCIPSPRPQSGRPASTSPSPRRPSLPRGPLGAAWGRRVSGDLEGSRTRSAVRSAPPNPGPPLAADRAGGGAQGPG